MPFYVCAACQIMIVAEPESGARVPCPSCQKSMNPKQGSSGGTEMHFPENSKEDSVLNLPVPEEIQALEEKRRQEKLKRLEMLEEIDRRTQRRPKK